jgi:hypothetical protein
VKAGAVQGAHRGSYHGEGLDRASEGSRIRNTLTLSGKLRPTEHAGLLSLLRNAPSDVRVIDHIEYDDAPVSAAGGGEEGAHPVPELGHGAIHVPMSSVPTQLRSRQAAF